MELKTFHLDDMKQPATAGVIHAAQFACAGATPAGKYFDTSLVWGPVAGRMGYAGLGWRL